MVLDIQNTASEPEVASPEPVSVSPRARPSLPVWKKLVFAITALTIISVAAGLILEIALRFRAGSVFSLADLREQPRTMWAMSPAEYDATLGYTLRPGDFDWPAGWSAQISDEGFRSNGSAASSPSGPPILAIGDSFTFGYEVNDHQSWPAQLQSILGRPVLNAGVPGYGVDQIVLSTEQRIASLKPDTVILALISDDIDRCEMSYRLCFKPHYDIVNGEPVLTPPPSDGTEREHSLLWRFAGRSHLARALLIRAAPEWWRGEIIRVNDQGEQISMKLITRLDQLTRESGAQLIIVTLGGQVPPKRLDSIVAHSRNLDLPVIDLAQSIADKAKTDDHRDALFQPGGHASATLNRWIAEQIAAGL